MIALSEPNLSGNEWIYIKDCLDTNWVSSVGKYVNQFETLAAEFCGSKYAVATSNGTLALHMSLLVAGVQSGDLVIAPNITFVASLNSIKYTGAEPILIDISEDSWQMDLSILEKFLANDCKLSDGQCIHGKTGRRIRAIMPVHVLGNMCDMERLLQLAKDFKLVVVEDSTEALGSYYKNQHAGSFGLLGCLSFNGNKIITTGGGGMILTNDESLAKRAKHLTTQAKSHPTEYFHDEVGYNYRMVNILAAMGVAQMEQLPTFLEQKSRINSFYDSQFENIPGICVQKVSSEVKSNHWLYTIKVPDQPGLRKYLRENQVDARPFWVPMNQLPAYKNSFYVHEQNVSDRIYHECLSLPCSTNITEADLNTVASLVQRFYHD